MRSRVAIAVLIAVCAATLGCRAAQRPRQGREAAAVSWQVRVMRDGKPETRVAVDGLDALGKVAITVEGGPADAVAVGLIPAFQGLTLSRNPEGTPLDPAKADGPLTYYLVGEGLAPGTYELSVVARDRAACRAKGVAGPECEDGRRFRAPVPGADVARPFTLVINGAGDAG